MTNTPLDLLRAEVGNLCLALSPDVSEELDPNVKDFLLLLGGVKMGWSFGYSKVDVKFYRDGGSKVLSKEDVA